MGDKKGGPAEYKTFPSMALKFDEDKGIVDHVITVFGVLDHVKDISHPGSFKKTLQERGDKVRVLDMHRADSIMRAVAKPLVLKEVGRDELPPKILGEYPEATGGVVASTKFLMDTPEGKGAFIRLKEGAVDEWSYGYDPLDVDYSTVKQDGEDVKVRNLRQIRLYEYGPVLWGANPATITLSAKAKDDEPDEAKPAPDVTENTIRIRVRDPGDFQDDSFRTINIGGEDSGIKAVVGRLKGETTMTVQSYVFSKDKFSVAEAQAWVDEHKKDAVPDLDEKQTIEDGAEAVTPTETDEGPYRCECLNCGHVMESEKHCRDIKCPKCGGEMRRAERPGPGQKEGGEPGEVKFTGSPRNPYGTHASRGYPGGRDAWKRAWRIHMSGVRDQGPVQGTIRRVSMIAAGMKPPCKIPEMSAEDVGARSGACGKLSGDYKETPGDYGLSQWKKPSDGGLEQEDIQLTCQDLTDIKRVCLQEIAKRQACKEEGGKGNYASLPEGKEVDEAWAWEIGVAFGLEDVAPPWEKSAVGTPEGKATPEEVVLASVILQNVMAKLGDDSWERQAAELAVAKLRALYGDGLDVDEVAEMERKAGRVLAARNAARIAAALTSLIEVLEDAGVDIPGYGKEPSAPKSPNDEEEEKNLRFDLEVLGAELEMLEME
jgi:phage head maturation protease